MPAMRRSFRSRICWRWERKKNVLEERAEREGPKQQIREMREFLEQQSIEVTEYDELLVRRLIEKGHRL